MFLISLICSLFEDFGLGLVGLLLLATVLGSFLLFEATSFLFRSKCFLFFSYKSLIFISSKSFSLIFLFLFIFEEEELLSSELSEPLELDPLLDDLDDEPELEELEEEEDDETTLAWRFLLSLTEFYLVICVCLAELLSKSRMDLFSSLVWANSPFYLIGDLDFWRQSFKTGF